MSMAGSDSWPSSTSDLYIKQISLNLIRNMIKDIMPNWGTHELCVAFSCEPLSSNYMPSNYVSAILSECMQVSAKW